MTEEATARKLKQDVFIRVCKDSGFKLTWTNAAILAGNMLNCSPLEIWMTMDMQTMEKIAAGEHPVCEK